MRNTGPPTEPSTDQFAALPDPKPPDKHPVRPGDASLPRGVAPIDAGQPIDAAPPVPAPTPAREDAERPAVPPPADGIEPWPVAREEKKSAEPRITPAPRPAPGPRRRPLRAWLIGIATVFALAYLVPAVLMAGRIPPGFRVLDVDLGGLSAAAAADRIRERLYAKAREPIIVEEGGRRLLVKPQEAGIDLDAEATVARAPTGFPSPAEVWAALTGGRDIEPAISVDRSRLALTVELKVAAVLEDPGQEGGVVFRGVTPVPIYPRESERIDRERVAADLVAAYLRGRVVVVRPRRTEPQVSRAEVRRALAWAQRAVAAPLTLTDGRGSVTLPPAELARHLRFTPDRGVLRPVFDAAAAAPDLERRLRRLIPSAEAGRDASLTVRDGRPVLVRGRPGKRIDTGRLAADVVRALDRGERMVRVLIAAGPPRVTDQEVLRLGVKEEIGRFTLAYGPDPAEAANIRAAARRVSGVLVRPGETFSLNTVLGRRDGDPGFTGPASTTVAGGRTGSDVPGVSRFATAMLNAALRAGLQIAEYTTPEAPGSPLMLEAAVAYPAPDLRWRNDSPYGVLVWADAGPRSLRITLWSTKRYDVRIEGPVRSVTGAPPTVERSGRRCTPTPGRPGVTVTVTRILRDGGTVAERRVFRAVYPPKAGVTCR